MRLKKFFFKKVKSTNETAIRLIKRGEKNGIISSDIQTNGKGQRGKNGYQKREIYFLQFSLKLITNYQ